MGLKGLTTDTPTPSPYSIECTDGDRVAHPALLRVELAGLQSEQRTVSAERRRVVEILRARAKECLRREDVAAWEMLHELIDEVEER